MQGGRARAVSDPRSHEWPRLRTSCTKQRNSQSGLPRREHRKCGVNIRAAHTARIIQRLYPLIQASARKLWRIRGARIDGPHIGLPGAQRQRHARRRRGCAPRTVTRYRTASAKHLQSPQQPPCRVAYLAGGTRSALRCPSRRVAISTAARPPRSRCPPTGRTHTHKV